MMQLLVVAAALARGAAAGHPEHGVVRASCASARDSVLLQTSSMRVPQVAKLEAGAAVSSDCEAPCMASLHAYVQSAMVVQEAGVQIYGEYVAVERFDQPEFRFWPQRKQMGYEYYQKNFGSFAAMLDWSADNDVDWGWKEGRGGYGQLFYQAEQTGHTPKFGQVRLWERPVDFDSNEPAGKERIGFVRKDVLLEHPSWQ